MNEWVCLNGKLMPAEEARVSVFDSGFMQGVGLFETMRAYRGRVFRLDRHLDRLANSARDLGWSVVPEPESIAQDVAQVLSAMGTAEARVRVTVTTGSLRATAGEQPELTIVVSATPGGSYPEAYYRSGVSLAVSRWRQNPRDPLVGHKTTSYFGRLASLREAHGKESLEALWLTDGDYVAEGAISNVFAVRNGELWTPPLETPVLPGITRATVLELADALGMPAREARLTLEQLQSAEEVFLTNSMMEVMPVIQVDRERIGDGRPGAVTQRLADAYRALVNQECHRG